MNSPFLQRDELAIPSERYTRHFFREIHSPFFQRDTLAILSERYTRHSFREIHSPFLQKAESTLYPQFHSSLSSALLHLIRRDDLNERVCCRVLSLLPTFLPASQRDIATCIVGSLFVRATKRGKDVLTDTPNALRKQAGAFLLHTDSLSPDNLVSFLLLPMANSRLGARAGGLDGSCGEGSGRFY